MARRRKLSSEINVVPYIDVMLVLLIIFMVTAPLMTQGIEVDLPDVNAQSITVKEKDRVMTIKANGDYILSFSPVPDQVLGDEQVRQMISEELQKLPEVMILVAGDAKVPYERVAHAMSLLNEAGARKIGFITEPGEGQK